MRSRFIASFAIAAVLLVSAPVAHAQETHFDATAQGTTGLFSVPLAAVLGGGEFAVSAAYGNATLQPGDSNVDGSAISGAFGLSAVEGLEIYARFAPYMATYRLYTAEKAAGVPPSFAPRLEDHPYSVDRWNTGIGDIYVGAKYRVSGDADAYDGMAILAQVKLPTSSTDDGIGTGKVDFSVGFVASAEAKEMIGITSYIGGTFRSSPDLVQLGNKFDFGVGLQIPTRFWVSAIFEATGSLVADSDAPTPLIVGAPYVTGYDPVYVTIGVRASHESGIAGDFGYNYNVNVKTPAGVSEDLRTPGWQAKLSYTNNRSEPVVLVGAAPMDLPPVNRAPTIRLRAERTSVRVGESVRLFADVSDPDGDDLTVTWATQAGSINPRQGETVTWSSQGVRPGRGPVSARVSDGYGGTAEAELTLTVTAPPPPAEPTMLTFSCSEFPSGNTRIDNRCKAILDDVALQLRQNPRATAVIAGHSDSAGSAEVNNTMSLERADNAAAYLVDTHGITGNRIDTVSAGSSEPIADNATAEGRLQNRRIVVVVTIPAQ